MYHTYMVGAPVLVTGATGNVGRPVVQGLRAADYLKLKSPLDRGSRIANRRWASEG